MPHCELQYRLSTDKDLPGILELWEKYSGWGAITQEQYNNWYLKTPYGPCIAIVAVDHKEDTVGQIVFIPSIIYYQGKQIKGLRVSSPILNEQARVTNITDYQHPIYALLRKGIEEAKKLNYEIVYMFPSKGWTSVLKKFPKYSLPEPHIAFYDCFTISLETPFTHQEQDTYTKVLQTGFNEEYDELWKESQEKFPLCCAVQRSTEWLTWKTGGYLVLEVRNLASDKLLGYTAINKKSGLIVDMLARTKDDLNLVIRSVIQGLHISNTERHSILLKKLNGILTPPVKDALTGIPFEKESFNFTFSCFALTNSEMYQSIDPCNWYIMPND